MKIDKNKVSINFCTFEGFKRGAAIRRNCFKKCGICRNDWIGIKSEFVHYTKALQKNGTEKEIFFCDDCKNKL